MIQTVKELCSIGLIKKRSVRKKDGSQSDNHYKVVTLKRLRKKAVRNAADRKDIKEPIFLFLPSLTKSIGICTPIVPHVLTGISALQRLALRRRGT